MDACFEHQPPTKTVEYLAQGLPVIATDTAGNRSFIRHGVNGILSSDTPATFGQAIIDLLQSSHQIKELAAHARTSVTAFNWENIVREQVIPHYKKVLARQA
ncbi:MAG TPA: glycosyltransferase, partial [Rhodocyclaceae bacterium]|nr:glycosyltransferase [Rhodocyclaceae bacterium]